MKIKFILLSIVISTAFIYGDTPQPPPSTEKTEVVKEVEEDYITEECKKSCIDEKIVRAVIETESKGNEKIIGDNGESYGLMQIQPKWHSDRMERLGVTDLLDGRQNVKVGIDILKELYEKYGSWEVALTVYNAGHETNNRSYYNKIIKEIENENYN